MATVIPRAKLITMSQNTRATINAQALNKYFTKPWYLHPWLISVLFGLWFIFGIPLLIALVLLIVNTIDNKKKKKRIVAMNLDKVAELDILERQIKQKTLHDKSLTVFENLKKQYTDLKSKLDIAQAELDNKTAHKEALLTLESVLNETERVKKDALSDVRKELDDYKNKIETSKTLYEKIKLKIDELKTKIIPLEEQVELQNLGFYGLDFDTQASAEYKTEMIKLQNQQKAMVKSKTACEYARDMTYNGSLSAGKKMVQQSVKMSLWSFNTHCDNVIAKVTYRNRELSERKIRTAFEVVNSNDTLASISYEYLELKIKELDATFKYKELLEHEKELLREQKEQEREDRKLQQEIARERAKIEKDETHINTELARLHRLLLQERADKQELQKEVGSLESKLVKLNKRKEEVDFREAHAKAGYVYVISNIGAFGKDIVKIGVTRRLEPIERINELGDASVPFRFDVHALMFSDQAYKLEKALHDRFADQRLNQVNSRKEFFRVPLEQVRDAMIREFNGVSVEFHMQPDAKEFRQSIAKLKAGAS